MDAKHPIGLDDVILEERSRGRRPISTEARRRRKELLAGFRDLIQYETEKDFLDAIRALGLQDDSPQFRKALEIWRQTRGA